MRSIFSGIILLCAVGNILGGPVFDPLNSWSENGTVNAVTIKGCGKSLIPVGSPDRIVGGKYAKHGQFPWIVSIMEEDDEGFEHICGGSVLNEYWILTAAHCFDYPRAPWKYEVYVGLHKLSKPNAPTAKLHKVSKLILHEGYKDDDTYHDDIALIRTAKPIDIGGSGGYVNGICLPTSKRDPSGYATVVGWGHTMYEGDNSDTLKQVTVPIIPREDCNDVYDDDPYDEYDDVIETMICAGSKGRDACQADSGGPLFQTNNKGITTQIGVVSHGTGCGSKYFPGVYTKVASYLDWITRKAK